MLGTILVSVSLLNAGLSGGQKPATAPLMLSPTQETIHHLVLQDRPARVLYEDVARMAGIHVTFDPAGIDSPATAGNDTVLGTLSDVILEDALDAVSRATRTSWKIISSDSIYVTRAAVAAVNRPVRDPVPPAFDISRMAPDDALRAAIRAGRLADVRQVVENGADVNSGGITPLMEAVTGHSEGIVRFLLEHGANVAHVNPTDGRGVLHDVCAVGEANMIPVLVAFGADPMQRDRFGQTPLNLALEYKNEKAVRTLLQLGVKHEDLLAVAADALDDAAVRGYSEIARILLENGVEANAMTRQGSTYLGDAALKGQAAVVRVLLEHGAKIAARNRFGDTALQDAALGGSGEVVKLLLERGAEVDARNGMTGATALMMAVEMGHLEAVTVLLKGGANVLLRDSSGRGALDRAKAAGNLEMVKLIAKMAP